MRLEWRVRWHIIGSRDCGTHMKRLECQAEELGLYPGNSGEPWRA